MLFSAQIRISEAQLSKPVPYAVDAYFQELGSAVAGGNCTLSSNHFHFSAGSGVAAPKIKAR
jgi:hypothetical protein